MARVTALALALALAVLSACSPFATASDASDASDAPADAAADADATADGGTTADAPTGALEKLVFVTQKEMVGAFSASDAATLCNTEGQKVKATATFVPWLSITSSAIGALPNEGVWKIRGGDVIFPSRASITQGVLGHAIDENADGTNTTASAWTNTNADGTVASGDPNKNCQRFSSGNGSLSGIIGKPTQNIDAKWTNAGSFGCGTPAALICFEL